MRTGVGGCPVCCLASQGCWLGAPAPKGGPHRQAQTAAALRQRDKIRPEQSCFINTLNTGSCLGRAKPQTKGQSSRTNGQTARRIPTLGCSAPAGATVPTLSLQMHTLRPKPRVGPHHRGRHAWWAGRWASSQQLPAGELISSDSGIPEDRTR